MTNIIKIYLCIWKNVFYMKKSLAENILLNNFILTNLRKYGNTAPATLK